MPKETARWNKPQFNDHIVVPRIAKYELDPYEFMLYCHYVDGGGTCKQGTRTVAKLLGISNSAIVRAKKSLEEKGYITVEAGEPGESDLIIVNEKE